MTSILGLSAEKTEQLIIALLGEAVRFFGLESVKRAKKIEFAIELRTVEKTRRVALILENNR